MNSLTDEQQHGTPGAGEADEADGSRTVAFAGDRGQLTLDTRRILVQLLLGPSVDAKRQTKLWPILLRDEAILRSRLHDLFLDLVIDYDQQVAFTRQVVAEDISAPILLRKSNLTFLESALLLFLRQRLTQADAQGDRAVVSQQEMLEHLSVFERDKNADHAKFERQTLNAVDKAKKLSLIRQLSSSDKRFEVAPTLKLLFPAEEILALTRTYENLTEGNIAPSTGDDDAPTLADDGDEGDEP